MTSFMDRLKNLIDDRFRRFDQQLFQPRRTRAADPAGHLGRLSKDRKTVLLDNGTILNAIISGNASWTEATIQISDTTATVIGEPSQCVSTGKKLQTYILLWDNFQMFYIGFCDGSTSPMLLYPIDMTAALGHAPGYYAITMEFSKNERHLFITDKDLSTPFAPGDEITWSWLPNWTVGIDFISGHRVVNWDTAQRNSITVPADPTPEIPVSPDIPGPFQPVGNAHYVLQWEHESDPNVNIDPDLNENDTYASFYNYDDVGGLPHTVWYGKRNVVRSNVVGFRPKYCYNANFEGHGDDGVPYETYRLALEPDTPPYCSKITYDDTVRGGGYPVPYKRRIRFLAGFIEDVHKYDTCPYTPPGPPYAPWPTPPPVAIWYDGYITNQLIAPPAGNDPKGPGNCYNPTASVEVNAHYITDASDVAAPIPYQGPFLFWFHNGLLLTPAGTKDGTFTNWTLWQYPYLADYTATIPPTPIPNPCSLPPDHTLPDIAPPYLESIPNIFAIPFQWANVVYKNYLWSNIDGVFHFLETNTLTSNSTETSPVVDPQGSDLDTWLQPKNAHRPASGTNWSFGSEIYRFIEPDGTVRSASVKLNMDSQVVYAGQALGPRQWYTSDPTYLKVGAGDVVIPAELPVDGLHRSVGWLSNEMLVKNYYWINSYEAPIPIPPAVPSVPPFVLEDPPTWGDHLLGPLYTKLRGTQGFETAQVLFAGTISIQPSSWNDVNSTLSPGNTVNSPQWDGTLGLYLKDWSVPK